MFTTDTRKQGHKLLAMLDTAVASLEDSDTLTTDIRDLGDRHLAYGVRAERYALFEDALHWALSHGLGERYTPDVAAARRALFGRLADTMRGHTAYAHGSTPQASAS